MRHLWIAALVTGFLLARAPAMADTDQDYQAKLEEYLHTNDIDHQEAAVSFYQKMVDAGCKPSQAYRWTRMALFADKDWNLADLVGVVEMQLLEGATRQVVEDAIEKKIRERAGEMEVDLAKFTMEESPKKKPAKKRRPGKKK